MKTMLVKKISQIAVKKAKLFYKDNNYPTSFMGYDQMYSVVDDKEKIIAAVIISYISEKNEIGFLHSLVVSISHQRNGYASQLLKYVINKHNNLICFADITLEQLYTSTGFIQRTSESIPCYLYLRYNSYLKKKPNLKIYTKIAY